MYIITHEAVPQSYIIDRVISQLGDDIVSVLEEDEIKDGICFALSLEWVRRVALGDVDTAIRLNEKGFVDSNDALYKQIAANFFHYSVNTGMSSVVNRFISFVIGLSKKLKVADPDMELAGIPEIYQWYVDACSRSSLKTDMFFDQLTADDFRIHFEKKFDGNPGVYLVGSSNHQMAFACIERDRHREILFYEPNCGVCRSDSIKGVVNYFKYGFPRNERFDICNVVKNE